MALSPGRDARAFDPRIAAQFMSAQWIYDSVPPVA